VLIHANLKSLTVEELTGRKKDMHLAAFNYSLAETVRDLERLAREGKAEERLARDSTRVWKGVTHTMAGLLGKIKGDCEAVAARHAAVAPERCALDLGCREFDQHVQGFDQCSTCVERLNTQFLLRSCIGRDLTSVSACDQYLTLLMMM
jgi:hypothetical protein